MKFNKKYLFWIGFKAQFHNNIRYKSLLPRIYGLDKIEIPLITARYFSLFQYELFSRIIIPIVCFACSLIYKNMLCTTTRYINYFFGSIIVDLDDPKLTKDEALMLNNKKVKVIVVTTIYIKKALINNGVNVPIIVIPQGVDLKYLNQEKINKIEQQYKFDNTPVIGLSQPMFFVGKSNWPVEYDISFLIQAMEIVWKKIPEVKLWIIGKAQDLTRLTLEKDKRIKLFGYLNHEELLNYISNFDIAVYPRRLNLFGRFSIKMLEYLTCSVPIVSTNVDESFVVKESGAGYCEDSVDNFAKSIVLLAKDIKLRQALGRLGKKYSQNYNWDDLAIKYKRNVLDKYLS